MSDLKKTDMLDDLFATAKTETPMPSGDFMLQMQQLALDAQPMPHRAPEPKQGVFAQILGALGGWPAVAGLAAATVAGVWIGAVSPETMTNSMSGLLGTSSELYDSDATFADPLSGFEMAFAEG
jgi:hypothetical protein